MRGAPAGTLQILDQETRIALISTSDATQFQANSTGGIFTFRTSNLAVGSHSLQAFFTRTSGLYASSQSRVVSHTVNKRTPSISVTVSGNRLSSTNLAFLVTGDDPVVLPTGIVTIRNASGPLGSGGFTTSAPGSSRSLVSIGNLNAGTRLGLQSFSIDYAGDANFNPVSLTRLVEIQRAIPAFVVPAPPATVTIGSLVSLNIDFGPLARLTVDTGPGSSSTADANGTSLPVASFTAGPIVIETARIEDRYNETDFVGNPVPCVQTKPQPLVDCTRLRGFASVVIFGSVGSGTLQVSYPGDTAYDPVTRSFPITVTKGAVSLSLTAVQDATVSNRQVRLTASFSAQSRLFPSGTLQFFDGTTLVQTVSLAPPALGSTFASSVLATAPAAGLRTYRVVYSGDANWFGTETQASVNVQ